MSAVYRFKVTFEDYDDVIRIIEVKATQTFFDFHKIILESIGFDNSQLASFYFSDDQWKKGDEISLEKMKDDDDEKSTPALIMKKCALCDYIDDPHQKFIYIYDYLQQWTFLVEMTDIQIGTKPNIKYPNIFKSSGIAPKQYEEKRFTLVDDDELEEIATEVAHENLLGIDEDDDDELGLLKDTDDTDGEDADEKLSTEDEPF